MCKKKKALRYAGGRSISVTPPPDISSLKHLIKGFSSVTQLLFPENALEIIVFKIMFQKQNRVKERKKKRECSH